MNEQIIWIMHQMLMENWKIVGIIDQIQTHYFDKVGYISW